MSTDLDLSDFHEPTLLEVLTRNFLPGRPPVDIPPYQRPYRWSISEVRKLLEDLDSFRYNSGTKSYDESTQYYYGTICFHAYDGKLELIDGQQRLTSFLILIKALLEVTDGITEVKHMHDELIETIKTLSSDQDWHENQWHPQYEYRQPQTQEHIAAIYREQFADYLRVRKLIHEATQLAAGEQDSNNEGRSDAPHYVIQFFTDEFKRQIVDLYNAGKPPSEIEREYDLGHSTLRRWIKSINATGSPHAADNRTPEQNRIIELERENKRLRMEVDVLKQAAPIFARK